jgi:hypothetical protein
MTRVVAAAAVVGALALLGRWWRDARTDARLAQVDEPDAFVPMAAWDDAMGALVGPSVAPVSERAPLPYAGVPEFLSSHPDNWRN